MNRNPIALEPKLGYSFRNKDLLRQALTHHKIRQPRSPDNNQRLEFLGDRVLNLIIADFLFAKCPEKHEGKLTLILQALISAARAAEVCQRLQVAEFIDFENEELLKFQLRNNILADVFEAIIAAIYLDGGIVSAADFILKNLIPKDFKRFINQNFLHPKCQLQTLVQGKYKVDPVYNTISNSQPPPNTYLVEICAGTRKIARGNGRTLLEAETNAANRAIARWQS